MTAQAKRSARQTTFMVNLVSEIKTNNLAEESILSLNEDRELVLFALNKNCLQKFTFTADE